MSQESKEVLLRYLDDARGVVYDDGRLLVWFGGPLVNEIDPVTGEHLEAWTLDNCTDGPCRPDQQDAMAEMRARLKGGY